MSESAGVDSGVWPPWFRQRTWRLVVIDVLAAVVIILLTVSATIGTALRLSSETTVGVWLVALVVGGPLVVRRRWPLPVFGVVVASAIVAVLLGMSLRATALSVAVALYPVALSVGPRRSAVALGTALLGATLAAVLTATVLDPHLLVVTPNTEPFNTDLLSSLSFSWFTISAGWALGRRSRARREYANQIAEHRAQQAVSEERLRIAREMHDVVGHSMSVIVMKAAVAESGELHLAVIDNGTRCRPDGEPGHGLIGMRERAALHHGTLMAGWQPHDGFAVHARLPYQTPEPA